MTLIRSGIVAVLWSLLAVFAAPAAIAASPPAVAMVIVDPSAFQALRGDTRDPVLEAIATALLAHEFLACEWRFGSCEELGSDGPGRQARLMDWLKRQAVLGANDADSDVYLGHLGRIVQQGYDRLHTSLLNREPVYDWEQTIDITLISRARIRILPANGDQLTGFVPRPPCYAPLPLGAKVPVAVPPAKAITQFRILRTDATPLAPEAEAALATVLGNATRDDGKHLGDVRYLGQSPARCPSVRHGPPLPPTAIGEGNCQNRALQVISNAVETCPAPPEQAQHDGGGRGGKTPEPPPPAPPAKPAATVAENTSSPRPSPKTEPPPQPPPVHHPATGTTSPKPAPSLPPLPRQAEKPGAAPEPTSQPAPAMPPAAQTGPAPPAAPHPQPAEPRSHDAPSAPATPLHGAAHPPSASGPLRVTPAAPQPAPPTTADSGAAVPRPTAPATQPHKKPTVTKGSMLTRRLPDAPAAELIIAWHPAADQPGQMVTLRLDVPAGALRPPPARTIQLNRGKLPPGHYTLTLQLETKPTACASEPLHGSVSVVGPGLPGVEKRLDYLLQVCPDDDPATIALGGFDLR